MDRRKALAIAGTTAATLVAAGGALAANFGLLSAAASADPVGKLPATAVTTTSAPGDQQPSVTVVYEDTYVKAGSDHQSGDDSSTSTAGENTSGDDGQTGTAPSSTSSSPSTDHTESDDSSSSEDHSTESQSSESELPSDD